MKLKHSKGQLKPIKSRVKIKVVDEVIKDINSRSETGKVTYGTYLYPFNGRSAQIDLYQELLDAAIYTKQGLIEQHVKEQITYWIIGCIVTIVAVLSAIYHSKSK